MAAQDGYVALFIDWDNLAISTAAEHGGAVPDLRKIVQVAQSYGTVLLARAYAEWANTTDRLMVYRAGIEPVYAPTFRFEESGPSSKGKSLADPCLIADCVDALHLYPMITTFVLVSGDKDLIPFVRLAQLRGKRVVVIGPDLVAAVLREMASEFIPYRSLINGEEKAPPAPEAEGQRRRSALAPTPPSPPRATSRPQPSPRPAPSEAPEIRSEPVTAPRGEAADRGGRPVPAPLPPAEEPPAAEPLTTPRAEDLQALFAVITEILRDRGGRLRATNLKDHLLARIPGFHERRYGFARFKDLLEAIERAGVVTVQRQGPVQWLVLPAPTAEPAPPAPILEGEHERQALEAIRFILDLRRRSRWLTYTYLLTNLISHVGRERPTSQAEQEARHLLNLLVQEGVLRVDREPQEIDFNGTKHRVRLCHLVETHPLVRRALSPDGEPATPGAETPAGPSAEPTAVPSPPEGESATPEAAGQESPADVVPPAPPGLAAEPADALPDQPPATDALPPDAPATPSPNGAPAGTASPPAAPASLGEAFAALVQVIREMTGPERPMAGAAGIKARLVRQYPGFDERAYGFSKFKEFLLAAEQAGLVRIETAGAITRVALVAPPSEGEG